MDRHRVHPALACALAAVLLAATPLRAQTSNSSPTIGSNMPSDIDPQSGFRLPLPKREDLDEAGKKAYDRGTAPVLRSPACKALRRSALHPKNRRAHDGHQLVPAGSRRASPLGSGRSPS